MAKIQKQGRNDHIKQLNIQPPYISFVDTHVLWKKIPVGGCILQQSAVHT